MDLLVNWLWQGGIVAVALLAMLTGLRRSPAQSRYIACWTALSVIAILPAISLVSSGHVEVMPSLFESSGVVAIPPGFDFFSSLLAAVWAAWGVVHVARVTGALITLRRLRATALPFPEPVAARLIHWTQIRASGRPSKLVTSERVPSAAVLVGRVPCIAVAPLLLTQLEDTDLERVLVHEWAHVQRRDDVALLLQWCARVVIGWHPAVWWIDRRLRLEREIACDEMAVAVLGGPRSYANCLVTLAGLPRESHTLAAPGIRPGRQLRARVTRIVSTRTSVSPAISQALATATVVALCILGVAASSQRIVDTIERELPVATSPLTRGSVAPPELPVPTPNREPAELDSRRALPRRAAAHAAPLRRDVAAPPIEVQNRPDTLASVATEAEVGAPPDNGAVASAETAVAEPDPVPQSSATQSGSTPWERSADLGVAIGQRSKAAGLGAAGAFRRLAGRVAKSF